MTTIELGRFITGDQVCEVTTQALLGVASAVRAIDVERGDGKETTFMGIHDPNQCSKEINGVFDYIREHVRRTRASAMELRKL